MIRTALESLLAQEAFAPFLVFVRVGSAFTVLPGVGEAFVLARYRLLLALAVSVALAPVVRPILPALPDSAAALALLIGGEVAVGLFLGAAARIVMAAVQIAGQVVAFQSSLSTSFAFDPGTSQQGAATSAFLGMLALVLIFANDFHHLLLRAVVDSYALFAPGAMPPLNDVAEMSSRLAADSFLLAAKMSAPFLVFGLVFYFGLGLVARLMPQIQVFFVAMPLQIMVGLLVFAATMVAGMSVFLDGFEHALGPFVATR